MTDEGKKDVSKAGNIGPINKSEHGSERLGEAVSKPGLKSTQVGRKIVGQGKRREALKKWVKDQD
ncbi:hypothetical protein SAMN05216228_1010188 [Rhizobium tibeticum]|uniref:Uncharacterized protein n=1 Tax=Rhizobium tibeticum TaxID=501024 RepID=A0A1H8LAJ5_9HYPH|nr:hypothetical protein [Rhizobium tibeticum]SEH87496.1 hypothetical protein RTCCBAU85039_2830 [Rhizobium tibeticum]SEO02137.1 hypothetical protein SAMN05216228_1010188 [Rhizobium tibeticum]